MSPQAKADALAALMGEPSPVVMEHLLAIRDEIAALREAIAKRGDEDRWLNSKEAAEYLGLCKNTFEMHCYESEPRLPGKKVGGKVLFKRSALDQWVNLWEVRSAGLA